MHRALTTPTAFKFLAQALLTSLAQSLQSIVTAVPWNSLGQSIDTQVRGLIKRPIDNLACMATLMMAFVAAGGTWWKETSHINCRIFRDANNIIITCPYGAVAQEACT